MSTTFGSTTTAEEVATVLAAEIKGKNVLITGVSPKSLGAEAARIIAKFGAGLVVLAGRSQEKLEQTERDIKAEVPNANIRLLILDLGSFATVRAAADEVLSYSEPLHVLINNAAIMAVDYALTSDGHETQFGVNHLGHFLFTARIFPKLQESGAPRIVNVSSSAHPFSPVRFDDLGFDSGKKYDRWHAYGQSKTANILFSKELARRGVISFSVHPGGIRTNLQDRSPQVAQDLLKMGVFNESGEPVDTERVKWKTVAQGAATHIVAAFDPSILPQSGSYLADGNVETATLAPHATDPEDAKKLWDLSEKLVGEKFVIEPRPSVL
ncbi:hypothetical protein BOTBODRAFT_176980 [Botryobasidium botryosum FD-172 SS1]|uniref:Uncharacterized protein n=1 Tax=Botryobasidium botryosum (strain FD-172 SS1) TaxID=930990 RepID=A0A067M8A3_BOTB1|nr:hypothetical protein BOTBODRAFT_176980 [Botryobasidium botryosum FD-172 SS1]